MGGCMSRDSSQGQQDLRGQLRELFQNAMLHLVGDIEEDSSLDMLVSISETDQQWATVLLSIALDLDANSPLSALFVSVLMENLALPSQEVMLKLNIQLVKYASDPRVSDGVKQNIMFIWCELASMLAGRNSVQLMSPGCVKAIKEGLKSRFPGLQLGAVLALEQFAKTTENKERIMKSDVIGMLAALETSLNASTSSQVVRQQLKFCTTWTLDNVFATPARDLTLPESFFDGVNVILSGPDSSPHVKLSRLGLECRNDSESFSSVRATSGVSSGQWYFEVTLLTGGVMQIGLATKHCTFHAQEGRGVGDDSNSVAFDGCRRRLFHRDETVSYGGDGSSSVWAPGDIVGVLVDIDGNRLVYSLNGKPLGDAMQALGEMLDLRTLAAEAEGGLFPAASLMTYQHCVFNFGVKEFEYPPMEPFSVMNDKTTLDQAHTKLKARLVQHVDPIMLMGGGGLSTGKRSTASGKGGAGKEASAAAPATLPAAAKEANALCEICCTNEINCVLCPCNHQLCDLCALRVEICPVCRHSIDLRAPLNSVEKLQADGATAAPAASSAATEADGAEPNAIEMQPLR